MRSAVTTIFEPALRGVEPRSSMMVTSTLGSPRCCSSARALIQLIGSASSCAAGGASGTGASRHARRGEACRWRLPAGPGCRAGSDVGSSVASRLPTDRLHVGVAGGLGLALQRLHLLDAPEHALGGGR